MSTNNIFPYHIALQSYTKDYSELLDVVFLYVDQTGHIFFNDNISIDDSDVKSLFNKYNDYDELIKAQSIIRDLYSKDILLKKLIINDDNYKIITTNGDVKTYRL